MLASNFRGKSKLLNSHRSWDAGAFHAARSISKSLQAPLIHGNLSRLVIDLNRSLHHPCLFSEITKKTPLEVRETLIRRIHNPFRLKTRSLIERYLSDGHPVHHFSIHSFTPTLNGVVRTCEIGLLYDPKRLQEQQLAIRLKHELLLVFPNARVRMNYPYNGTSDGHTKQLRSLFSSKAYAGIEIELNQAWLKSLKKINGKLPEAYRLIANALSCSILMQTL